jgi:hypothetical protein
MSTTEPRGTSRPRPLDSEIRLIREVRVILDSDLARLYGVTTKALLQAVRRNPGRFPEDFILCPTNQEVSVLRSQSVTSNGSSGRGGRRAPTYAFTYQGVAMLSSVLRSAAAVQINVEIMRAFVRLRRAGIVSRELLLLVDKLSARVDRHDSAIAALIKSIRAFAEAPVPKRSRPTGFTANLSERDE